MMCATAKALCVSVLAVLGCYPQSAARLEFEAASLKPSRPFDFRGMAMGCRGGPGTNDPGMFICENTSLSHLMLMAYLTGNDRISAPGWASSALFDLSARVPKGTTADQFVVMLQNLLADRFHLVVHHETRQRSSYDLVVAKNGPKFQAAGAPAQSENEEAAGDAFRRAAGPKPVKLDEKGYPVFDAGESGTRMSGDRGRMYEPRMTMERLAGMLSANQHAIVNDATGLKGEYEISLFWTINPARAAPPGAGDESSMPEADSAPTLVQAIQSQLGLRLVESRKVPIDVVVVDHAEKVPTVN